MLTHAQEALGGNLKGYHYIFQAEEIERKIPIS